MLTETLEEEKETDEKLTKLSQQINAQANEGDEEKEQVADKRKPRRVA